MMIFKCVVNFTNVGMFQNVTIPAQKPLQHDDHWRILTPRYRYNVRNFYLFTFPLFLDNKQLFLDLEPFLLN
jgi:hypothetical protein